MEEKKKAFFYTRGNKFFRGFLFLITFLAFIFAGVCSAYGVNEFGEEIFDQLQGDFSQTKEYSKKTEYLLEHVLRNVDACMQMSEGVEMIYPSYDGIYTMDYETIEALKKAGETGGESAVQKMLLKSSRRILNGPLYLSDYEETMKFLSAYDDSETYICITDAELRDIFCTTGIPNTFHRFSEEFSEHAYFVFAGDDHWVNEIKKAAEMEDDFWEEQREFYESNGMTPKYTVIPREESNSEIVIEDSTEETERESLSDMETTVQLLDEAALKAGPVDSDGSASVTVELPIIYYNIEGQDYAVYDPDQNLYYSVWDEYFNPCEAYIYKVSALCNVHSQGVSYSNFIFPMLSARNYQNLYNWNQNMFEQYQDMLEYKNTLDAMKEKGILYCLVAGDINMGNADFREIKEQKHYCYAQKKTGVGTVYRYRNGDYESERISTDIADYFTGWNELPGGSMLYVGLLPYESLDAQDADSFVVANYVYPFFARYMKVILVVAVLLGIFLLIQGLFLIKTTGYRYKGDKECQLNPYDRLPTEIWLLLGTGTFVGCGVWMLYVADRCWRIPLLSRWISSMGVGPIVSQTVVTFSIGSIPGVLCLLLIILSLARRGRAHNLVSRSWVVKGIRSLWRSWKEKRQKKRENVKEGKSANRLITFLRWCRDKLRGLVARIKEIIQGMKGTRKLLYGVLAYGIFGFAMITLVLVYQGSAHDISYVAYLLFAFAQIVMTIYMINLVSDTDRLMEGVSQIVKGNLDYKMNPKGKTGVYTELTENMNHIGDGLKQAVETSLKDERMKTELITNVSHDLKTPLTSIINYINLLKTEKMPTPEAERYVEVLDGKAQRLRQLTEDLVEAAKATSGNIELVMMPLAFDELMRQAFAEFEEKFSQRELSLIVKYPAQPVMIKADGRRLFRVLDNVLQNIYKYAMPGTRVYADVLQKEDMVEFTLKNVSAQPLNISSDELMERFTRGDRSRTTEGSGLGLSIAKDLVRLQGGSFDVILDGDLFKVVIRFSEWKEEEFI